MDKVHQIYFLQRADGLVKIGTTKDFPRRLHTLSKSHGTLVVLRLINGDQRRERQIHQLLRHLNEYGEWFRPDGGALIAAIDALHEGPPIYVGAEVEEPKAAIFEELKDVAARRVGELIWMRTRFGCLTRQQAIVSLWNDYSFSENFILHLVGGRAASLTSDVFAKINDAWISEASRLRDTISTNIAAVELERAQDGELMDIGRRLDEIAAEIAARKAALK